MRAIILCEYSARVRDAMRRAGHDAWSCDLLPCEGDPRWHLQCDAREVIGGGWDIMIAHPPCTYLCSSGLHWNKRRPERAKQTEDALEFVRLLLGCKIPRKCLENPIGCISTRIRPPEQIIQPWQFGHPESKATCLWLENLPPLKPTKILALPQSGRWENQTASGQNRLTPGPERAKLRSLTYQGIADAMGEQWGALGPFAQSLVA